MDSRKNILHQRGYRSTPQRYLILCVIQQAKAHHHLMCRGRQAILHLDQALLGNLHESLEDQYHFHGLTLALLAADYCDAC